MANIVPFESAKLPAALASMFAVERLGSVPGSSFPTISIKGKVFHKVQGGERELITKPGEDEPASSIEVVIVNRNPKALTPNRLATPTTASPPSWTLRSRRPRSARLVPITSGGAASLKTVPSPRHAPALSVWRLRLSAW